MFDGHKYKLVIDIFKIWLPSTYHKYVTNMRNVLGNGNCGFRSVVVALDREEECDKSGNFLSWFLSFVCSFVHTLGTCIIFGMKILLTWG